MTAEKSFALPGLRLGMWCSLSKCRSPDVAPQIEAAMEVVEIEHTPTTASV